MDHLCYLCLVFVMFYHLFIIYLYLKRTAHLAINASLPCVPLKHIYIYTQVFASVYCCRVVTCWERADLMALVCDV